MGFFNYLKNEIWSISLNRLSKTKAFGIKTLRLLILVGQSLQKGEIQKGAAFLTYYSLLSIVPIIAFLVALAKTLSIQEPFFDWLKSRFAGQETIIDEVFLFANQALENTSETTLAILGFLFGVWAGIKMLAFAEKAMNDIWQVMESRSLSKKFSDYLAALFFLPLLIFTSALLTVIASTTLTQLGSAGYLGVIFSPLKLVTINVIPILLSWLLLTFLYIFIPNTFVKFQSAWQAGFIIAILSQLAQVAFVYVQVVITKNNATYGTFVAIPLFLIWIHINWVLLLMGSKIAFVLQNITAHDLSDRNLNINARSFYLIALHIMRLCIHNYQALKPPIFSRELADKLQLSLSLTHHILNKLCQANLLTAVAKPGALDYGYQPAIPTERLTLYQVICQLEELGESIDLSYDPNLDPIYQSLEAFNKLIQQSDKNSLIRDLPPTR